jgi:tripartite-type tricarboxylate transporter receptor subunit TctC
MTLRRLSRWALVGLAALALGAASRTATAADEWPSKPIHVVVPFPAGGSTDVTQRYFADRLSKVLNQTVIIENTAGAGGSIGGARVARAAPDGYTILGTLIASIALLPHQQKLPYDPIGDFTGVVRFSETVGYMGIHKDTGITSLKELIEKAKAAPNKYRYASAGVGSILELRMEEFNHAAGIAVEHIPYQGGASYLNDFIAGRIDVVIDGAIVKAQADRGVANVLATFGDKRMADFPNVPTVTEIVPSYRAPPSWQVYLVPKGTPASIVKRLASAIRQIAQDPETAKYLVNLSQVPLVDAESDDINAKLTESYDIFGRATARLGLKK